MGVFSKRGKRSARYAEEESEKSDHSAFSESDEASLMRKMERAVERYGSVRKGASGRVVVSEQKRTLSETPIVQVNIPEGIAFPMETFKPLQDGALSMSAGEEESADTTVGIVEGKDKKAVMTQEDIPSQIPVLPPSEGYTANIGTPPFPAELHSGSTVEPELQGMSHSSP